MRTATQDVISVGLTGGIGTGKSTVARLLEELGASRIDADEIAREVVEPGMPALSRLVERFGEGILTPEGALDRRALAAIVFTDAAAREEVNAIVHPPVVAEIQRRSAALRAAPPRRPLKIVVEVPLLFEAGLEALFDETLVVAAKQSTQEARLITQRGLSPREAGRRIAAQWPLEEKIARADHVIWNDGTWEDLRAEVTRFWQANFA